MTIDEFKKINSHFHKSVGLLNWIEDLEEIGLTPRDVVGTFWPEDLPILIHYCKANPDYHIVTKISMNLLVNRYDSKGIRFYLASGDPDPSIHLETPPEIIEQIFADLHLMIRSR